MLSFPNALLKFNCTCVEALEEVEQSKRNYHLQLYIKRVIRELCSYFTEIYFVSQHIIDIMLWLI